MHVRRSQLAAQYFEELADLPLQLPIEAPVGDTHAWHLFIARTTTETPFHRDEFVRRLAHRGIGTSVHFVPLHLHSFWGNKLEVLPKDFPTATREFDKVVSLPLFSSIPDSDFDRILKVIRDVLQ